MLFLFGDEMKNPEEQFKMDQLDQDTAELEARLNIITADLAADKPVVEAHRDLHFEAYQLIEQIRLKQAEKASLLQMDADMEKSHLVAQLVYIEKSLTHLIQAADQSAAKDYLSDLTTQKKQIESRLISWRQEPIESIAELKKTRGEFAKAVGISFIVMLVVYGISVFLGLLIDPESGSQAAIITFIGMMIGFACGAYLFFKRVLRASFRIRSWAGSLFGLSLWLLVFMLSVLLGNLIDPQAEGTGATLISIGMILGGAIGMFTSIASRSPDSWVWRWMEKIFQPDKKLFSKE
jgi:hypothetical protein